MKRLLKLALFLIVTTTGTAVEAQYASVTGSVRFPSGGSPTNAKICFTLIRYEPNVPRISGTAIIIQQRNFCVSPDSAGEIGTTLARNDNITPANTQWRVDYLWNNRQQSSAIYTVNTAAFDLDTATPTSETVPLVTGIPSIRVFECVVPSASTTWVCSHGLLTRYVDSSVFSNDVTPVEIIPDTKSLTDTNTLTLTFTTATAGRALIIGGVNLNLDPDTNAIVGNPNASQAIVGAFDLTLGGRVLPAASGQDAGSTGARWDVFANDITFYAATAQQGVLSHANTATRTYTFPDATGTLPLLSVAQTWSGQQTFGTANPLFAIAPLPSGSVPLGAIGTRWSNVFADAVTVGSPAASAGAIRLKQSGGDIKWRNVADTSDNWSISTAGSFLDIQSSVGSLRLTSETAAAAGIELNSRVAFISAGNLTATETTVNAMLSSRFIFSQTGATTVTVISNGLTGQIVYFFFTNGNTTIQNNASILLAGAVNFVGTAEDTLTLMFDGTKWRELGRSIN